MESEKNLPLLVFVGGFLGAGKTTLLLKAAERLTARNQRVAVIVNDQDFGLVDTQHARAHQLQTREISGGCFCCRFSDLMEAADQLAAYEPNVILAEPVGSCIDLSATIMQPLRAFYQKQYRLAPLTVLIDPARANQAAQGRAVPEVEYLFRNQLAEADILCFTKCDLYTRLPEVPFPIDFRMSGKTGEGVDAWLEEIYAPTRIAGARLLDVDYREYGAAEAALGWLNLHARVRLSEPASPSTLCGPLLESIEYALTTAKTSIAHLKLFDQAPSGWLKVSICSNRQEPFPSGDLLAEPARNHELAINLRAVADPVQLEEIVRQSLSGIAGDVEILHSSSFRPAQPRPEHRFAHRV